MPARATPAIDDLDPEPDTARGQLLIAAADDRRTLVALRLARAGGSASIQVVVLRAGELPLALSEVGVPVGGRSWEFRSSGLWVEAARVTPGAGWSYGLESFALAIDEPDELLGRGHGHRTPLGWELGFAATGPAAAVPDRRGRVTLQSGTADGVVLTGPGDETPFTGSALRCAWVSSVPQGTSEPDRWPIELPAPVGPPVEVALPLGDGPASPVWWVGHDGSTVIVRLDA